MMTGTTTRPLILMTWHAAVAAARVNGADVTGTVRRSAGEFHVFDLFTMVQQLFQFLDTGGHAACAAWSCASNRESVRATPVILASWPLLTAAAANAGVKTVRSIEGVEPGRRVRIEGVLSIRGSTPLTILVLETSDGDAVTLRPHTAAIEQELRNLDGLRVAVEGEVLPPWDATLARLDVDRYEMLKPPGGGNPIIGMVGMEDGACVLTTSDGKRYWIVGELAPALCQHDGARVWMVGKKAKRANGNRPPGTTPFTPTGYGVIGN
jgi:hypothetical protein